ncbi:hypothetical protein ABW20_dc0100892 [Dactylellina cionopaga]|nr:hypothetical protein ABW20_dc0100892 [Dactylellina cionopaga]
MPFSTLPIELLIEIFSYFTAIEQFILIEVCTTWEKTILQTKSLQRFRYSTYGNRPLKHNFFNKNARLGFWSQNGVVKSYRFLQEEGHPWPESRRQQDAVHHDDEVYDGLLLEDISNCGFLEDPIFATDPSNGGNSMLNIKIGRVYICSMSKLSVCADYPANIPPTVLRWNSSIKQLINILAPVLDERIQKYRVDVSRVHEIQIRQSDISSDGMSWKIDMVTRRGC